MGQARLKMISGGRDGEPERRRAPRRPPPGRVRLVHAAKGEPAPPPKAGGQHRAPDRRRVVPRPTAIAAQPRSATPPTLMTWVFALVLLVGLACTLLWARALTGAGLAALGLAGLIAPPRRTIDPAHARVAMVLSGAGVALVGVGMMLEG